MNRVSRAILALTLALAFIAAAALALAQTQAAGQAAQTQTPGQVRWINPIRGVVQIQYIGPDTKGTKDQVVTTIKVKNMSSGPIARLKVEEFWWDRNNNLVVSNQDISRKPVMPGDIVTFTMTTPRSGNMFRNNCKFSHAYGTVDPKQVRKF
jgi:hypothetical protein